MDDLLNNPWIKIIYKISMVEEMQVRKWIEELENELAEKNRFFPDGKVLKLVDKLVDAPHKVLEKGTKIFRARTIDKYHEQQYFSSLRNDINRIISVHIPDFDINNGNYALMNLAEYVQKNNIKNIFDTEEQKIINKYGVKAWWGYNETESDAPPQGIAGAGRINPKVISYLYAADNKKTAALEVRPVISQYVSIAEIEIKSDLNLFDFTTQYDLGCSQKEWDCSIVLSVLSEYFSSPNYSGDTAYLATQYISEYIKHIKTSNGKKLFDGLCFKSSLDNEGLNYVLFDISETKKYKINNSSIYQMMDLTGKLQQQLPLSNEM